MTVIRYILTRRDVTGLYPVSYYGLCHTAARLLWSFIGNRFCVIVAHWYSLDRVTAIAILRRRMTRKLYKHKELCHLQVTPRLKQKISRGLRAKSSRKYEKEYELGSEAFQTWWGWHNSTAKEEDKMCPEDTRTTNHLPSNINFNWTYLFMYEGTSCVLRHDPFKHL